jgi:hypothetical protein
MGNTEVKGGMKCHRYTMVSLNYMLLTLIHGERYKETYLDPVSEFED